MRHLSPLAPLGVPRWIRSGWLVLTCVASLQACVARGTDSQDAAIPKDTFVTAYVQLREAALSLPPEGVDSAREAILAEHHLSQQDMLTFAEVHGRDVTFMKDVWDEVEQRLNAMTHDSVTVH